MKNLRFLLVALSTNFKLSMALRFSFFTKWTSVVLIQGLYLSAWGSFFSKYTHIGQWTFNEMIATYGIITMAIGITELCCYGLRDLPRLIDTGGLDSFLVQPKNVILSAALSKGDISGLGEFFLGIILLGYSGYLQTAPFSVLALLPPAILFIFSLYVYLSSLAFTFKNSRKFIFELIHSSRLVMTQPNTGYSGFLKMLTFSLLPTALISRFPVEFLRTNALSHLAIVYGGTALFYVVASRLFHMGLRKYESGNTFFYRI